MRPHNFQIFLLYVLIHEDVRKIIEILHWRVFNNAHAYIHFTMCSTHIVENSLFCLHSFTFLWLTLIPLISNSSIATTFISMKCNSCVDAQLRVCLNVSRFLYIYFLKIVVP